MRLGRYRVVVEAVSRLEGLHQAVALEYRGKRRSLPAPDRRDSRLGAPVPTLRDPGHRFDRVGLAVARIDIEPDQLQVSGERVTGGL